MRSLIVALTLILAIDISAAVPKCHMKEVMDCVDYMGDYLNSLPKRHLPETKEEFDGFCEAFDSVLTCRDGFMSQCMTPIQRELDKLLMDGLINAKDDLCSPGSSKREKLISHGSCLNKVAGSEKTHNSLNYFMAVVEKVLLNPNDVNNMAMECCAFNKVYNSIKEDATETCGAEAVAAGEELIMSVISQLPNAVCGGYDPNGDECRQVKLADDAAPTGAAKDSEIMKLVYHWFGNFLN